MSGPEDSNLSSKEKFEAARAVYYEHVPPSKSREELLELTPEELADYFEDATAGFDRFIEFIDSILPDPM